MIEQETTITFNRAEPYALIGTCDPKFLRKLKNFNCEVHRNDGEWVTFKFPKKKITLRNPIIKAIL